MATLKRSHNETSMKNKYDALKELEKGVPQKEVALLFGVQKSTLSTWKRNKTKIKEAYHAGLGNKRMRPEKYKDLNKALMKWFLNCRSENIPLDGPLLKDAKPPVSEVQKAIEILEKVTLFSRSGEYLMSSLKVVKRVIHAEEQLSKKQSTINAYFRKEK